MHGALNHNSLEIYQILQTRKFKFKFSEVAITKTVAVLIALVVVLVSVLCIIIAHNQMAALDTTPNPTPSPTPSPTSSTPSPTPASSYREIGVPYEANNNLTVTLNSLTIVEKTGSYQYVINYTLKNETPDSEIGEGAFKIYYKDAPDGTPQYGFFESLFPDDSITRTYTFEELKTDHVDVLAYGADLFFTDEPPFDSLQWQIMMP